MTPVAAPVARGLELLGQALVIEPRDRLLKVAGLGRIIVHAQDPGNLQRVSDCPEREDDPAAPRCLMPGW